MVVAIPEIEITQLTPECDFFILACDGIFDKLTNPETVGCVWEGYEKRRRTSVHEQTALGVELILKTSCARRSLDNVTALVIGLDNFSSLWKSTDQAQQQVSHSPLLTKSPVIQTADYLKNSKESRNTIQDIFSN